MASLIIGNSDCSFESVCNKMQDTKAYQIPIAQWTQLPTKMISHDVANELASLVVFEKMSYFHAYLELLRRWRDQEGSNATLRVLIKVLEEFQLNDAADELREAFGLEPDCEFKKTEDFKMDENELIKHREQIRSHIRANLGGLSRHTMVTPSLQNALVNSEISEAEVDDKLRKAASPKAKSVRFYNFLMNHPDRYNAVICALEEEKQLQPYWLLRKFFRGFPNGSKYQPECPLM